MNRVTYVAGCKIAQVNKHLLFFAAIDHRAESLLKMPYDSEISTCAQYSLDRASTHPSNSTQQRQNDPDLLILEIDNYSILRK